MLAAVVVGEIGFYWGHRWSHETGWLWRFHAVHHSATHVNFLVNSRAHPVDIVFTRACGLVLPYATGLTPLRGARRRKSAARRLQADAGDAGGDVEAGRTLDAERLERHVPVAAAEQGSFPPFSTPEALRSAASRR